MRKDSCRSCGEMLQELQSCPDCKESIQFKCSECRRVGEIQIHAKCNMPGNAITS